MSLSVGLLSPWSPARTWGLSLRTTPGFRSLVCVLVVLAVALVLAYLTNPTEISFRTYLTKQSFRQHLTHLDDLADDSASDPDPALERARTRPSDRSNTPDRATLPFHFANRASVSLRTPLHVFHSFGVCTIATTRGAAVPASARRPSSPPGHVPHHPDLDGFVSSDAWFIGAFGRWWRAGLVEPWCYDAMIRSKDAQGWSSGILGFKALDKFHEYNALPFAKLAPCPRPLLRGAPPKLRNRERSTQRPGSVPHRNASPPPLPKSASLPLHADHRLHDFLPVTPQSSHVITDQKRIALHAPPVAHALSRTSSVSGASDHSLAISDILKQIAAAQASVHDLQIQLQEAQSAADQSRDSLEEELGHLRLRRREDDQRRLDVRARSKTLEETRRLAETTKREADKKLKIARNAKDSATRGVEALELEIQTLRERTEHDRAALVAGPNNADLLGGKALICELERKKKEVQVAEEVVVSLNIRARELEDKIDESKSRLRAAQHRTQPAKVYPGSADWDTSVVDQRNYGKSDGSAWSSSYNPFDVPIDDVLPSSIGSGCAHGDASPESKDARRSPTFSSMLGTQSYAVCDDMSCADTASLPPRSTRGHDGYFQPAQATRFSPFCDPPTPSAAFIPSSLISVLDSPSADWKGGIGIQNDPLMDSPVEYTGHSLGADPSDLGRVQGQPNEDQSPMLHSTALYETSGSGDLQDIARKDREPNSVWHPVPRNEKHRSGLNPDAKVFHLARFSSDKTAGPDASATPTSSYDALNPTGLASGITSSTPSSLLRAFAPSRAERQVLQRALGGSTNASLERLPSLSEVGSISPSPTHTHAELRGGGIGEKDCALPVWLQSLPLIRKPNFSPWEDEDPVSAEVKMK